MDGKRKAEEPSEESLVKRLRPDAQGPLSVCVDEGSLQEFSHPPPSTGSRKSPSEERNLFVEMEKMRKSLCPSSVISSPKPTLELGSVSQIIPSVTHHQETSGYVDTTIQPSPKDSGVDMSSPERKIEDLGGLSSQESSPRIVDPTLPVHVDKGASQSKPKYTAFGNIPRGNSLYLDEKEKHFGGVVDPNMNHTEHSVCDSEQCKLLPNGSQDSRDIGEETHDKQSTNCQNSSCVHLEMNGDDCTDLNKPIQSRPVSAEGLPNTSAACDTAVDELAAGSALEDPEDVCNTDCTLAELNMSQKSTEVELQSLVDNQAAQSSDSEDSGEGSSDFEAFEKDECLDDDLFSSLNEDSVCFTASGSPSKKLYLTPQSTPRHGPRSCPKSSLTSPTSKKNAPSSTGFLSEFTKFLQKASADDDDADVEETSNHSRPCSSASVECEELCMMPSYGQASTSTQQSVPAGHKSSVCVVTAASHPIRKPVPIRPHTIGISAKSISGTKAKEVTVPKPRVRRPSESQNSVKKKATLKPTNFKPQRFINQHNKVMTLRRKVIKLLRTLFPNLDYPSSMRRTLNTADILLDQVLCCVKDRQRPAKKVDVIPTESSATVLDVRIVVCKRPLGCLRQLRRKVCHFLEAVLPGLDLGWPFDRTGCQVEELLSKVILCNCPTS